MNHGVQVKAAVIDATDVSLSAVQNAVNSAHTGDTVEVPAGSAVWTGSLEINTDIQLIGAGPGQTIITDGGGTALDPIIGWVTSSNNVDRLSGITFQGNNNGVAYDGSIQIAGDSQSFRIDHCQFIQLQNANVRVVGSVAGCVDHCYFYLVGQNNGVQYYPGNMFGNTDGYGDGSWANPVQYGATNNWLYIESCGFYCPNYPYDAVDDNGWGGRIVFRYNMCTNVFFQGHGTETSQRFRGARACEVYENVFLDNVETYDAYVAVDMRSGSGVMFSNTITEYGGLVSLNNYRASGNFAPWGASNGQNLWDSNNLTAVASGTFTGTNGSWFMISANANWSPNQWVGGLNGNTNWAYEIQDVTQGGTNSTTFALIASNGPDFIYPLPDNDGEDMSWNNGDSYKIYQVYFTLDQVGLGSGQLVKDTSSGSGIPINSVTGQPTWPYEAREPLYQWGNTLNGTPNATIGPNFGVFWAPGQGGAYVDIIQNRDYFDNTVKPGYTPLPYPYPLDTLTNQPTYQLTVSGGTGSGSFTVGTVVGISANATSNGPFAFWVGPDIANTNQTSTTVTMPASNITVTAYYSPNAPATIKAVPVP
ncbi:MAG TPA: hypothetical protein VMF08_09960 [Candidatus Sulfotelmatobacter sp.]|nr:hypothetical protein [Candidatus Sulfotelmatobacter sp.]